MKIEKWNFATLLPYLFMGIFGLLCIAGSLLIKITGTWSFIPEFIKELGIVILAVFVVSLFYEKTIAKRQFEFFRKQMQETIEKNEKKLAVYTELGIHEIYKTREEFKIRYPLAELLANLSKGSELRVVAISLFNFMGQANLVQKALENGAKIELCIFNPNSPEAEINKIPFLQPGDLHAAVSLFNDNVIDWIQKQMKKRGPNGSIEIRYHNITLFDTLLIVKSKKRNLAVWDLNFGRDMIHKRGFLLDPQKPLGIDLFNRFDKIYNNAELVYKYENNQILEHKVGQMIFI